MRCCDPAHPPQVRSRATLHIRQVRNRKQALERNERRKYDSGRANEMAHIMSGGGAASNPTSGSWQQRMMNRGI